MPPRIKEAALGKDGRLSVTYAVPLPDDLPDTGTTTCKSHQYRVRIEGDLKALYFYSFESAAAMAQCLRDEGIRAWIEEKDQDHTGAWWISTETV